MTQNIYDDDAFLKGYCQLPRSVHGLDGAPEWASMQALLPPMDGLSVLDLGCGFGWFSRWAAEAGAGHVLGLDVSRNMLARAKAQTSSSAVEYELADLENLDLSGRAFDLAYSSLAFHYVADFDRLARTIHQGLKPGGSLVFSIEHPINTAPSAPGWTTNGNDRAIWPLDGYFREGLRRNHWFVDGVEKYHRTLGTTFSALIAAGFDVDHLEEWRPSDAQMAAHPEWEQELDRPMFLLMRARRSV